MIAYVLLWMIPLLVVLLGVVIWLISKVLKEQKSTAAAIAQIDQSAAIRQMEKALEAVSADLDHVLKLIAQDVRMANFYKEDRDELKSEVDELIARAEKAEAEAQHEKNRRIGAVNKMEKLKSAEKLPF